VKTTLWQWAKDNGYTPKDLAKAMGYKSPRYVEQIIRGWEKITPAFIGRFVRAFPNHTDFFLSVVSDENDIMSGNRVKDEKCPLCGAPLENRPDGLYCPNCGTVEQ
jgi:plasmid maintenance system antidote protein VapI